MQNGDSKLFKWFVGQAMGRTRGMADPTALNQALSVCLGWSSYEEMMATCVPVNTKPKGGKKKKKEP